MKGREDWGGGRREGERRERGIIRLAFLPSFSTKTVSSRSLLTSLVVFLFSAPFSFAALAPFPMMRRTLFALAALLVGAVGITLAGKRFLVFFLKAERGRVSFFPLSFVPETVTQKRLDTRIHSEKKTLSAPDLSEASPKYAAASPSPSSPAQEKQQRFAPRRRLQQAFAGAGAGPGFYPGGGARGFDPFSFVFGPDARFPFAVPPSTTVEPLGEAGDPSPALQQPASPVAIAAAAALSPAAAPAPSSPLAAEEAAASSAPSPAAPAAATGEAPAPAPAAPVLVQPLRRRLMEAEREEEGEKTEEAEEAEGEEARTREKAGAASAPSSPRAPLAERDDRRRRSLLAVREAETDEEEQKEAEMMATMKRMHPEGLAPSSAFGMLAERHAASRHRSLKAEKEKKKKKKEEAMEKKIPVGVAAAPASMPLSERPRAAKSDAAPLPAPRPLPTRRSLAQFPGFPFQGGPFDWVFGPGSNVFTPVERATGGAFRGPVTLWGATPVSPIEGGGGGGAAPSPPSASPAAAPQKPAAASPAPSPSPAAATKPASTAPSPAAAVPVAPVG